MEDVQASYLKNTNDKSVTFHNTVPQTSRAEVSKHYVTRRLSKPDKYRLYQNRPDLDPNRSLESLNRIRSEDINVNDPNFKKSMLDNRFNGGDNKRGNNNRLSKKGVISSLLDAATQSTTSSSTSSYTSASSHSPVRVSSLQEADTSFQPSAFSSPPTAIRVEPSDSLPTGLMTNRDTLTFYQDEPEPEEASAEDVIRTELMEAQEFGISPHKREESLQRAEAARAMGSSPNEATPTTSTDSNVGLLSPLIWNQHPNPDATNSGRYPDSPA
jgi:hypothetical protein